MPAARRQSRSCRIRIVSWASPASLLESRLALVENGFRGGRPDAGDAEGPHRQQAIERTHAARGLHLNVRRREAAHEAQVLVGGPRGAIAGRGLDEIGTHLAADSA